MPERQTLMRAQRDKRAGKAPTTQAGEFIREEMHHIRERKHGARSPQQAIAIGLSKARRAGVPLKPPAPGRTSEKTRRQAERAYEAGQRGVGRTNPRRSAAIEHALERERHDSASPQALSSATRSAARRRSSASRSAAAQKATRTKGPAERSAAAKKAARTRGARQGVLAG
jgi:hypothetical protein